MFVVYHLSYDSKCKSRSAEEYLFNSFEEASQYIDQQYEMHKNALRKKGYDVRTQHKRLAIVSSEEPYINPLPMDIFRQTPLKTWQIKAERVYISGRIKESDHTWAILPKYHCHLDDGHEHEHEHHEYDHRYDDDLYYDEYPYDGAELYEEEDLNPAFRSLSVSPVRY